MILDGGLFRYLGKVHWRVLSSIEIGLKNHEYVSVKLITKLANLRHTGINKVLKELLINKLIAHDNSHYDGYKLTFLGYDYLALHALCGRGSVTKIGTRIGVGKEADVHLAEGKNNEIVVVKLHRLGRVSFRTIKRNRDYLNKKDNTNWFYISRLSATKEYAYLKILHENNFPVPQPIDHSRHAVVMNYVNGRLLSQTQLKEPLKTLEILMSLIVRFAELGFVHGDFNEFNLIVDADDAITVIDFPQIISKDSVKAESQFDHDVKCIRNYFLKHYQIEVVEYPKFSELIFFDEANSNIIKNIIASDIHSEDISQCSQTDEGYTESENRDQISIGLPGEINFVPCSSNLYLTTEENNF